MNTSPEQNEANNLNPVLQGIKDRNESYLSTIYALHGFRHTVNKFLSDSQNVVRSSIGRRMHFAARASKREFCTPDIVIQLNSSEGIVGEAKLLVCQNIDDHWNKYVKQIKKYDTDLIGWWTNNERIDHTNLVWITEIAFSSQISDYFQSKIDAGVVKFERPFLIIEFTKRQRARELLFLRTRMGETSNSALEKALKNGIDIPLETLIFENKEKKFYDAKPQDIEYVMEILWQNIFLQEAIDNESGLVTYLDKEKIWKIPINLDELTTTVQRLYGSAGSQNREVEYPQPSWIREALEKFISIGLAQKGEVDKEYIILFKKFPRPLERIIQLTHKKKSSLDQQAMQLELFQLTEQKPE